MDQLHEAIKFHDWYTVAAFILGAVVFFLRKASPSLWQQLPDGWRWLPAVVLSGATGFIAAHAEGKPLSAALLEAANAVFFVGLPAAGGHGMIKELGQLKNSKEAKNPPEEAPTKKEGGDA